MSEISWTRSARWSARCSPSGTRHAEEQRLAQERAEQEQLAQIRRKDYQPALSDVST